MVSFFHISLFLPTFALSTNINSKDMVETTKTMGGYASLIKADRADELYLQIVEKLVKDKIYKDPDYTAKQLADELKTNSRYISAVIRSRFKTNFSQLMNEYRVRLAASMLERRSLLSKTVDEIGEVSGFSNKQSYYTAFKKLTGTTPSSYRKDFFRQMTIRDLV